LVGGIIVDDYYFVYDRASFQPGKVFVNILGLVFGEKEEGDVIGIFVIPLVHF